MNPFEQIRLAVIQLGRRIGAFFKRFEASAGQREQQVERDRQEAERIDRICNPSKYLGK